MFSNVAMLKEIQTESRKTRQIKKWLVLAARMLAITALVLAFARPYLPNKNNKDGRQLVSIYLDNSQSMGAAGENGQLFENAKNAARQIIENLPAEAEIQILDNALSPSTNRIYTPANATNLIDDLEMDFHPNDIGAIVQKVNNKYIAEGFASQHTFAISDYQTTGEVDGVVLDSNINLNLVRLVPEMLQNLSIDSVWLDEPVVRPETPLKLKVKVVNNGAEDVESSSIVLKINGVQQGVESFGIQSKGQEILDLTFSSSQKGWVEGEVSLTDVPVIFDNQYFFSLNIKQSINVLQIGKPASSITKIFGSDKVFQYATASEGSLDYASLNSYDFIILNELKDIGSGLAEQLKLFIEKGGVAAVLPTAGVVSYSDASDILGLASYGVVSSKNLSISSEDLRQPFIRDVYKRIPKNTLLPKVSKCYALKPTAGAESILSLKDNSTILLRKRLGLGSLFQFALPLDATYSNLALHELFVLSMLKMAFSKSEKQQLAYIVFSDEAISLSQSKGAETNVSLVREEQVILAESAVNKGGLRFWLNDEISESGVYTIQNKDKEELAKVALNYSRNESIQKFATDVELKEQFGGAKVSVSNSTAASLKNATDSLSSGTPLWKFFIALCLIFLLIEILLLRFLKS